MLSDTWDFWTLITEYLPQLKDELMARDGTLVIRPDSGNSVKILTGYKISPVSEYSELFETQEAAEKDVTKNGYEAYRWKGEYYGFEGNKTISLMFCEVKGLIECLWEIFGGTTTNKGFKLLDDHIGAIYGDAITLVRQGQILQRLMDKGFASKVVLGIGSYSYQYVTRDTHGSAVKATSVVKNGERIAIFKDPKTDTQKKSARGLLKIDKVNGELALFDNVTEQEESEGLLDVVFENGELVKETTLGQIRERINEQI